MANTRARTISATVCVTRAGSRGSGISPARVSVRPSRWSAAASKNTPPSELSRPPSKAAVTFLPPMAGKENPGSISSSMAGVAIPVRHQAWSQHPNLTPNQELGPCPPAKPSRLGRVEDGRSSSAPFPVPAHQTGRADFPHPAFRLVSPRAYDGRSMRALFAPPLHLGTAVKLAWKAPGLMPCFVGSRQVTDPRLLQQAHQKSGPFPPLALPSLGSTTTLSDPHLCRRLSASLRPLPSPMMGLPRLPVSPFQRAVPTTPADQGGGACRLLPRLRGLPRYSGGAASATSLSRPAQASLTLRPAGLLNRPRRPSSRGFDLTSYPTKPLVSYQINRQLSGWILPPLVIRAVGAHRIRWGRGRCPLGQPAAAAHHGCPPSCCGTSQQQQSASGGRSSPALQATSRSHSGRLLAL